MGTPVVVSFIGQKGGVGKSTLARALAVVAANGKLRVELIDLDFGQQTAARWAQTRRSKREQVQVKSAAYSSVDEALSKVNGADLVVIDTPGFLSSDTLEIARRSDFIILPTGCSSDDLHPTTAVLYELQQQGISKERLCVALCRLIDDQEESWARRYLTKAGHPALEGSIPEHKAYRNAQSTGRAVTETSEAHLNERAYQLVGSVLKKILLQVRSNRVQATGPRER